MRGGGRGHRDDGAATHGLDQSGGDELVEVLGEPGQQRPDREDGQGHEEEAASAPEAREAAGERHGHDVDQQVAVDDPRGLAQVRPIGHRGQDLGQGHGRDHQLQTGQEYADAEDTQQQV